MIDRATVTHDSATCTLGPDGRKCEMCQWAELTPLQQAMIEHDDDMARLDRNGYAAIEQSAAAIRARRAALLERANIHSPTEGAIALADAHLQAESWWQRLPNNAMQDAVVLELAGRIESTIGEYVDHQCKESDQCD